MTEFDQNYLDMSEPEPPAVDEAAKAAGPRAMTDGPSPKPRSTDYERGWQDGYRAGQGVGTASDGRRCPVCGERFPCSTAREGMRNLALRRPRVPAHSDGARDV